jgi:hypothetical protein
MVVLQGYGFVRCCRYLRLICRIAVVEVSMRITTGVYRHYKGHEYRVFGIATHSESEEQMVVYQALYGDYGLWIRPLRMFCETVDVNGERLPRFALIREEPALIGLAPGQEA